MEPYSNLSWWSDVTGLISFPLVLPIYWAFFSEKGKAFMSHNRWLPISLLSLATGVAIVHIAILLGFTDRPAILFSVAIIAAILFAFFLVHQERKTALSLETSPITNEPPIPAEQTRELLLLIQKLIKACACMQQMANQTHGVLGGRGQIERHLTRASMYFMKPLEKEREPLTYFLGLNQLSHGDFTYVQLQITELYNTYEERRSWVRDIGWEAIPNLLTYSFYREWEEADRDMRHNLKALLPYYGRLLERITGLDLTDPWWWEQKPSYSKE